MGIPLVFGNTGLSSGFTFKFTFSTPSPIKFSFSAACKQILSLKRRRPLWDVDGSHTIGKKKRRLRLHLITSRLSRPFSSPATNIADRGGSRVAARTKGWVPERATLRKAAVLNRMRQRILAGQQKKPPMVALPPPMKQIHPQLLPQIALQDALYVKREMNSATLPPSPLGQAYYDALDMEDDDDGDDFFESDDDYHCF